MTALTFGILADQGKLSVDDPVAPWILKIRPDLKDAVADKQAIKLRHLMSMSSGLLYKQVEGSDPRNGLSVAERPPMFGGLGAVLKKS